jgi:hypothetical protein
MRRPAQSVRPLVAPRRQQGARVGGRRGAVHAPRDPVTGLSPRPANDVEPIPTTGRTGISSATPMTIKFVFAPVDDEVALAELTRILKRIAGRHGEG